MDRLKVRFHELPHSKPIRKFIESNFGEWMKRHSFEGKGDESAKVEFFRSDLDQKIGCYIEVTKGKNLWRNFEYGKGIQDTFQICLKHLSENTRLENEFDEKSVDRSA